MENLRKGIIVRLINNAKDVLKYTSRPTYIIHTIFGKDYAAIYEIKPALMLNKPIYIRFTILEFSKWLMYDFHYNFIKNNFNTDLLFVVTEFVRIKSKMYSMKIDGKEYNAAKGVNIAIEFNKIKDLLFNKKIIRQKMKTIQAKNHKIET